MHNHTVYLLLRFTILGILTSIVILSNIVGSSPALGNDRSVAGKALPAVRHVEGEVTTLGNRRPTPKVRPIGPRDAAIESRLPLQRAASAQGTVAGPASVQELARALKNNADLIFEYVYNNIEFTPQFALHKSPEATILDGFGGPFDQSVLLLALLREAGYTANYLYGTVRMTMPQLTAWLGAESPNDACSILAAGGFFPGTNTGSCNGAITIIEFNTVWVKVNIDEQFYVFDPSFKSYINVPGIDLSAAMAYSQSSLLDAARSGNFVQTSDYVQNINTSAMRSALGAYAQNLATSIRTHHSSASLDEVIGGRRIAPLSRPSRMTSLPYQFGTPTEWTTALPPNLYRTTMRVRYPDLSSPTIDFTFYADEIYGKRLTLFSNGSNQPVLQLEDDVKDTGTALTPGSSQKIFIDVDHGYPTSQGDKSGIIEVSAGGSYLIMNGWGYAGRAMVEYHRRKLQENRSAAGATDGDQRVLGESLATIAYTWLAERSTMMLLQEQITGVASVLHHTIGVVGQTNAPYIDLPIVHTSSATKRNFGIASEIRSAGFFNNVGVASALEWAGIEQNLDADAVSTVKLLDMANSLGQKIYDASSVNWTTGSQVRNILLSKGYSSTTLSNAFDPHINASGRIFLPERGDLNQGNWTGYAALTIDSAQSEIGHLVGKAPPAKGGFTTVDLGVTPVNNGVSSRPLPPGGQGGSGSTVNIPKTPDPVSLFTGDFLYAHDDLSVGGSGLPFGLGFQSSYNSGARLKNGPMGRGWAHNFDISAIVSSDPFQGLGAGSAASAVPAIVGLYASFDLLRGTKTLDKVVVATLVQRWLLDQLIDNTVTISIPENTQQFVKLADGSYSPPLGNAATLTKPGGTFLYRTKDGTELSFNSDNRLVTWKNANNVTVTFEYLAGFPNLVQKVSSLGRMMELVHNSGKVTEVKVGARSVFYARDASDNITSFTDTDGKVTRFEYDTSNRLTKIYYPAFASSPFVPATSKPFVTNEYDSLGRVKKQWNATNQPGEYMELFLAGYRAEERDQLGNSLILYLNPRGKTLKQKDRSGNETVNAYDGQDRLIRTTLPEGNSVEYTYDAKHNPLTITANPKPGSPDAAIVQSFTYEPTFSKVTSATDPLGGVTTFTIDPANGNVLRIDQPQVNGQTPSTIFTYNNHGRVLTSTDPTGKVTQHSYDATFGHLLSVTEDKGAGRLNLFTQFGYDSFGNVTSRTDPNSRVTTIAYDNKRRITQTTSPAPFSLATKFTYDADDNLTKVERATGVASAPWQTTTYTYNAAGKRLTERDPSGFVTTFEYDQLERLKKVIDPELRTTETRYDPVGRVSQVIDALGQIAVEYAYSPNGRRISLKDAERNETTYSYDGFDRLAQQVFADASFEAFTYNQIGNVLTKSTRAGQSIVFSYDPLNRLSTKAPQSQPTVTYAYDLAGRVTSVSDVSGALTYGYDTAGRNTSVTRPDSKVVSYQYDANGNRTRVTWPDAVYVTYSYDELNRMKDVRLGGTTLLASYGWDALSRRTTLTYGNATTATYAYRPNDDLASIKHQLKQSAVTFNYTYNGAGQRIGTSLTDDRFLFRPAANDNVDYVANALNQYTFVGAASITYDGNGNLTGDGVNTYAYDTENRLTGATVPGKTASYAYDPLGRRKSKTVGGVTTAYLHDGDREIAEYDGSGTLLRRYVYGVNLDEPLVQITRTGTRFYYRADALGSIVAHEEHASSFVQRFNYGPFGESATATGHPYRYTARRLDEETGLYYYRARYYSPQLGRFLQTDPIGYDGGINLYAYVGNDPFNLIDPLGLSASPQGGSANPAWAFAGFAGAAEFFVKNSVRAVAAVAAVPTVIAGGILAMTSTSVADATLCGNGRCEQRQQYVVRGGEGKVEDFEKGTRLTPNGYGFSVQTLPGVGWEELARGGHFPNRSVSVTTVEKIQAIPGVTVNFPTPGFGEYHGTVNVPNPPPPGFFEAISGAFERRTNPYPNPR